MARPRKDGLDYFPFDTDFFEDSRIDGIKARFGIKGIALLIWIYARTYRDKGYYLTLDSDTVDKIMAYLDVTEDFIWQVMTHLYSRSILINISKPAIPVTVTSPGIQKRYQAAARGRRRAVEVDADIWLLEPEETESFIKVTLKKVSTCKNSVNTCKNSINPRRNPTKERKGNKSKGNNIPPYPPTGGRTTATSLIEEYSFDPVLEDAVKTWVRYKTERRESYKETGLRCLLSEIRNKAGRHGRDAVIEVINYSMSNGYKGIIWERIGQAGHTADGSKPEDSGGCVRHDYDIDEIEKRLLDR